jgi:hypothetical protein
MKTHARAMMFSVTFCIVYTFAYYFDLSPVKYYPLANEIVLEMHAGPVILWYGWVFTAALAGLIVAAIVPRRWAARVSPDILWVVGIMAVVAVFMYEKRWFL